MNVSQPDTPTTPSPWLTLKEAQFYMRCGRRSVLDAVSSGALRHIRLNRRRELRFKAEWLDRFLEGLGDGRG